MTSKSCDHPIIHTTHSNKASYKSRSHGTPLPSNPTSLPSDQMRRPSNDPTIKQLCHRIEFICPTIEHHGHRIECLCYQMQPLTNEKLRP